MTIVGGMCRQGRSRSQPKHALVDDQRLLGLTVLGEPLGSSDPAANDVLSQCRVLGHPQEGIANVLVLIGFHMNGSVASDFGEGRAAGGDDGAPTGHGFDDGEAEAFVPGDEEMSDGGAVEGGQLGIGDVTEEPDRVANAEVASFAIDGGGFVDAKASGPDELQSEVGACLSGVAQGAQHAGLVLPPRGVADVQGEGTVADAVLSSDERVFLGVALVGPACEVDAIVDDGNARRWQPEEGTQVFGGVRGDGDDVVRGQEAAGLAVALDGRDGALHRGARVDARLGEVMACDDTQGAMGREMERGSVGIGQVDEVGLYPCRRVFECDAPKPLCTLVVEA